MPHYCIIPSLKSRHFSASLMVAAISAPLVACVVVSVCVGWCAWLSLQWQESRERERPWIVMGQCYEALQAQGKMVEAKECANLKGGE
jgi:predicted RNA-binding Zn ribbon-like protein